MESPVVCLNVAGCYFTTARETILREPASKLALQVRGVLPTMKDDAGHVFIDRDPRFFQAILNYLRDGWTLLPPTASERRELMQEVRFYQLNGMESWLRTQELLGEKSDAIPKPGESPQTDVLSAAAQRPDSPAPAPTTPSAKSTPERARAASPPMYRPIHCPPPSCPPPCCPSPCCPPPRCPSPCCPPPRCPLPCCKPACCDPCCRPAPCNPSTAIQSVKPCIPAPIDDGFRWTSKYLRTNPKIREIVDTLLELAYMPPNRALTVGKVYVSINNCPERESYSSNKYLVVKVRPSCDYCLFQKYSVCEYVQDNWFVLSAILKDQYGLVMEEDYCQRHSSILSRRQNLHVCLSKPPSCRPLC